MTIENWDFDSQQAATRYSVAQLLAHKNLPENAAIILEIFFVPDQDADAPAFLKALKTFGYNAETEEESLEGGGTQLAVLITIEKTEMSADNIWLHEERTTKIALARGYKPDGWGFLEP